MLKARPWSGDVQDALCVGDGVRHHQASAVGAAELANEPHR